MRKIVNSVKPSLQLVKEGDNRYSFIASSTFQNQTITFTPGEEFKQDTLDGKKTKTVITFEGNKMIEIQKGHKLIRIEREYIGDELIITCFVGDVVTTRYYKAIV